MSSAKTIEDYFGYNPFCYQKRFDCVLRRTSDGYWILLIKLIDLEADQIGIKNFIPAKIFFESASDALTYVNKKDWICRVVTDDLDSSI